MAFEKLNNKPDTKDVRNMDRIRVEKMRIIDLQEANKMYDDLSNRAKFFFHPGFMGYKKLNVRWFFTQCALVLSTCRIYRRFLGYVLPKLVLISFVAFNTKNEVVGFAFINLESRFQHGGYKGNLGIAVVEKYQGIGVGTKLMTLAISTAVSERIKQMNLLVAASNYQAIKLYKKHAFKVTKPEKDYWNGMMIDCAEMTLLLKDKVTNGCD
jgi:GNAT superfamily N-acetyltransferase